MLILPNPQLSNSLPSSDQTLQYYNQVSISLGRSEYIVDRPRLKIFLHLIEAYEKICEVTKEKDLDLLSFLILKFVAIAVQAPVDSNLPWYEIAEAYFNLLPFCDLQEKPPMLLYPQPKEGEDSWDYSGRTWYLWLHILASAYGWSVSEVENLAPEDALALLQEIFVDKQIIREWEWSLTDVSYKTDKSGKMTHIPLPRPVWMQTTPVMKQPKKVKIKRSLMPVGNVINLADGKPKDPQSE